MEKTTNESIAFGTTCEVYEVAIDRFEGIFFLFLS